MMRSAASGPGDRAGLADRLAQAGAADRRRLGQQRALVARGRAEALRAQAQHVGRRRQLGQLLAEHEPHPARVGQRLAERHPRAPGAALDELGGEHDGAQRPPAPLAAGQQAVDRAAPSPRWSWTPEADSGSSSRSSSRSAAVRGTSGVSLPWARSRASGPAGPKRSASAARGSLASSPSVRDPEALQRVGEHRHLRAATAAGRPAAAPCRRRAPRRTAARPPGRRARARPAAARRRSATAPRRSGRHERRRRVPAQRPARRRQHALERAAVQRLQPARAEPGDARRAGLDRRADVLQRAHVRVPRVGHPGRVGRDEPQRRAARERLPQPQPGAQAVRLGGRGDLADELLAPRLGRQRHRPGRQHLAAAGGDGEREAREQDADDHERMFASFASRPGREHTARRLRRAARRTGPARAAGARRPR